MSPASDSVRSGIGLGGDVSHSQAAASMRSLTGLHAASFFLAELTGVMGPFLNHFLRSQGWRYDTIGVTVAIAGCGVMASQTPAGALIDRIRQRRLLLAAASLAVGLSYGMLPIVPPVWWMVVPLLLVAGAAKAFFGPLLAALALALMGRARLNKTVGVNQSCNHLGNIAAALSAMFLVSWFSVSSVFYAVLVVSVLAAACVWLIRAAELDESRVTGGRIISGPGLHPRSWRELLRDRSIVILLVCATLFHLANAPVMPLVALNIKHLGGSNWLMAAVVLVAQSVMVPVSWLTGRLCDQWGRKRTFAIGFLVLPLRIFLYSLVDSPVWLVALQALDGIGAGVFGVAALAMAADLGHCKGRFNTLAGMVATAGSLGGVIGNFISGFLVQHFGFPATFQSFAAVAALAATAFVLFMPETRSAALPEPLDENASDQAAYNDAAVADVATATI